MKHHVCNPPCFVSSGCLRDDVQPSWRDPELNGVSGPRIYPWSVAASEAGIPCGLCPGNNIMVECEHVTFTRQLTVVFVPQQGAEGGAVHLSGGPGYVVGLPVVSGTRTAEYPLGFPQLSRSRGVFRKAPSNQQAVSVSSPTVVRFPEAAL